MADATMLEKVKKGLGVTGEYQDDTISEYVDEVTEFLRDAGVKDKNVTPGIVIRGVADLWNYGSGAGKLSEYFMQRATQLSFKD